MSSAKKSFIPWILGGGILLYLLSKFSFSQKANFSLRSITPGGSFFSPKIVLTIAVQNPTNTKTTLKSFTGSVYIDQKYLANISSFGDQVILPNSETLINFTARPSVIGVFNTIKELIQNQGSYTVTITGQGNIDGIVIPVNIQQSF